MGAHEDNLSAVVHRLWDYAEREFGDGPELFDRSERSTRRPPKFVAGASEHNLLLPPSPEPVRQTIVTSLPACERQPQCGSMRHDAGFWYAGVSPLERLSAALDTAGISVALAEAASISVPA